MNRRPSAGERQLRAFRARCSFDGWCLLLERAVGPAGNLLHVSPLVELCERDLQTVLEACGETLETQSMRRRLDTMRGAEPAPPARPTLRVVK